MDPRIRDLIDIGPPAEVVSPPLVALNPDRLRMLHRCLDVTSLEGTDSPLKIAVMCRAVCETPTVYDPVASVLVYPAFVLAAQGAVGDRTVPVGTVAAGFPHGLLTHDAAIADVEACAAMGVDEIDVVIPRYMVKSGDWAALQGWVTVLREVCGEATLNVILSTGELGDRATIYRAALSVLTAGAHFVKTSTGVEKINATPEAAEAILWALIAWAREAGMLQGLKVAGGIRTAEAALPYLALVEYMLGRENVGPDHFRVGASALLDDLRQHAVLMPRDD